MTGGPVVVGRIGAVLAVTSVALHVALLGAAPTPWAVAMLALAAICLLCAFHLWTGPSTRTWVLVALSGAAMLVVHVILMRPGASAASSAGEMSVHHGAHSGEASGGIDVMTAAMVVTVAEVLLAVIVSAVGAYGRFSGRSTRHRRTGTGVRRPSASGMQAIPAAIGGRAPRSASGASEPRS